MAENKTEAVARAFYMVMDDARGWECEPEVMKERFRSDARTALAMLDEFHAQNGRLARDGASRSKRDVRCRTVN